MTGGVAMRGPTCTARGTVAELLVAADLTAKRCTVYFPLIRNASCDMIILNQSGKPERIEVRTGYRKGEGAVRWQKPDISKSDRRAIVITGEPVIYEPPFGSA
jgi:hypothetical protein